MVMIREEFTRVLDEAEWLDESTRKLAKDKVSNRGYELQCLCDPFLT